MCNEMAINSVTNWDVNKIDAKHIKRNKTALRKTSIAKSFEVINVVAKVANDDNSKLKNF